MIKFFDFCSGIGAARIAATTNGLIYTGHSEIDEKANYTYELFFGKSKNYGDLMKISPNDLPDFDLAIAGFPCQAFSINGKRLGFNDERGIIIYGIIKILKEKKPKYVLLENVKGLVNHDNGNTLKTINYLLSELGYVVNIEVLNSKNYGVAQSRERIYIVAIRKDKYNKLFSWLYENKKSNLKDILNDEDSEVLDINNKTFQKYLNNKYNKNKFNLNYILKQDYLILDTRQSDLRLYNEYTPTLRTGRHGILYVKNNKLRKLSGYEALLLQGFPKDLAIKSKKLNKQNILSQAGNSMSVPVMSEIIKEILTYE